MNPLVSVIVPVYKVEDYLDDCIKSIIGQSFKDFELILVDDGSPDRCPAMCDAWAEKDTRIKVIHKKNGGVSSARNVGIDAAQGAWIWFVDGDDTVSTSALETLMQHLNSEYDLIIFEGSLDEIYKKDDSFFGEYYFKYRFGFGPCNKIYKAEIIQNNSLKFDTQESIGEDLLFNIHYYMFADIYRFLDYKCYFYRQHAASAMNRKDPERLQKQLRVFSKIYDLYQDKLDETILAQLFIMHLISGINQSDKADLKNGETYSLVQSQFEKYAFNKKAFQKAIHNFLNCENASAAGRIRTKAFFALLFKNIKAAFAVI